MRVQHLINGRIVLADRVITGAVTLHDDQIVAIDDGASTATDAIDLDGDYLIPGLVELHTDNLEKHVTPRPGARWPALAAVVGHDAQIAAAGITTVLDALAIGESSTGGDRLDTLHSMVDSVVEARRLGMLRADHLLHLRCEISHASCLGLFRSFLGNPLVRMVSIMDHTPGQRQFTKIEKYREYYQKKYAFSDEQFDAFVELQLGNRAQYGDENRRVIVDLAHAEKLTLASHDDATDAHVEEAIADGMVIAEFPTTLDAARRSRTHGMAILMGAPNVVRGGSHSGNISAVDLAEAGLLDILSSDYVPGALLHGAFILAQSSVGIDLAQAIATVTSTPARSVGLTDRGRIEPGLKADLVRVEVVGDLPLVRSVWRSSERVI
ncbi:MAG TPA: alpha-D-ribose 1-methylphosphonate 5-triphosphate diphosphatase [Stellaceae bacterium]|nr:alpha-D-ribose 1-methylphosphonate 5-triphosphate diphosphatase [Stellaceae bacterium]